MSPRPDVSEERRQQILSAAEEIFTRKGFDQARMDDIAAQTGLSKGTLYLYFKSKDELIIAILDRLFQREFRAMENLDWSGMRAGECLDQFIDRTTRDFIAMLRLMPVAYEFLALAFRNRTVQKAFKHYLNRYVEILVPVIQRGIETGEFRPVDPQEAVIAIGAIMEGTILLWVYDRTLVEPERHMRSGMRILLEGLQAR